MQRLLQRVGAGGRLLTVKLPLYRVIDDAGRVSQIADGRVLQVKEVPRSKSGGLDLLSVILPPQAGQGSIGKCALQP